VSDREIYEELRDSLMRFAGSLVGPNDAADLVSEVVVATLQRQRLESLRSPRAYLMQAMVNRARSRARRRAREDSALAQQRVDDPIPDHSDAVSDVSGLLAGLPVRQRAAVYLVYWEDLEPIEAARMMGVSPGTLRRYLYLARRKLEGAVNG
jgi:RNA polymerase sigma-70 factor (ECF subfamily)